ncbi:MAG TPA: hypothetical protein PK836_07855 [Syntrophales bacterium]|nr:hypothetical protein [Syntrophales bacterium]HOM07591.1 hypothetical protein [Syntrophales bacterium]HOO00204.1 hypothetical protein [Syntrophales bacterium]HPC01581.1 hypothetical protein [Syntrophales bacterium]HPQ07169.1 hypothetical protein [Syntrophales bacterium]
MKRLVVLVGCLWLVLVLSPPLAVGASEFPWMPDFNLKAEADPSGFRARLAARFDFDDVRINAVIQSVDEPADAYMVLRLGEMAKRPPEYVLKQYKSRKAQGWGAVAKSLGIKPGSPEFHALKRGDDLYGGGQGRGKGKGKGKQRD